MKTYWTLLILCLCTMGNLKAQSISGTVVDEEKQPLPYASVVLQSLRDSAYLSGVTTRSNGTFHLPVKADSTYLLQISYIGYETVRLSCKAEDVGTITLKKMPGHWKKSASWLRESDTMPTATPCTSAPLSW